jgi:hypothetical protein
MMNGETELTEHRTSNVQHRMLNEKKQVRLSNVEIGFLKTTEIKLRSAATSLFDVQCWMFDVRRSSLETTKNTQSGYLQAAQYRLGELLGCRMPT